MRLFNKLLFLWVGNITLWLFYGGNKSMDEVIKEDNEILGIIVAVILGFILYFSFQ